MKINKISMFIYIFVAIMSFCNIVKAARTDYDIFGTAKNWISYGESRTEDTVDENYQDSINRMLGTLQVAGVGIAVVIGTVLGISFMYSSAEKKADIKKLLIPYSIGVVIIFGGIAIWKFAVNFADELL